MYLLVIGCEYVGKTAFAEGLMEWGKPRGFDFHLDEHFTIPDSSLSKEDRDKHVRRIGWLCKVLSRNGVVAVAAFIAPYREPRELNRREIGRFVEVFVDCPVSVCAQRDVKGMYDRAVRGEIRNFTGVSDPYEEPLNPEVVVHTDRETPEESASRVLRRLEELGYAPAGDREAPRTEVEAAPS